MNNIELLIGLLVVVAALAWLASRLNLAYPIVLVLGGLAIALVPGLPTFELDPDLVFLLFLPPLLYYAGLLTSWRDFKSNLRPISFLAVGLVLFTTFLVAGVAHWGMGMGWAAAFALGAIVSPPDAVAATAITQRLRVPRRVVAILEGESLVNDATALIVYRVAIAVALGAESFSLGGMGVRFLWVAAAGVGIGYLAGVLVAWVRPRIHDPAVESTFSLLTPYIAYLPAEWLHVSGVLSVVTAGMYLSRRIPQVVSPRSRLRAYAMWETLVFILNGVIFILIGLQLPTILEALGGTPAATLLGYAVLVSLVAIVARIAWVGTATFLARVRGSGRPPRAGGVTPDWRSASVIAWTGMRGIVSLAAALALPNGSDGRPPFPHRELILFITFGVILATLVVQGLTLPLVIRWLRLPAEADAADEETTARYLGALAAIERLDQLAAAATAAGGVGATPPALARLRAEYDERLQYFSRRLARAPDAPPDAGDGAIEAYCADAGNVRRQALAAERGMVVRLRDTGVIGDEVLRRVQEELDLEASRLGE
jgi:CPA1 family monovalent cation:H+ antiporter